MKYDLLMARGAVEGGFNLAIGEPVLLQRWLKFPPAPGVGPYQYPSMEGDPKLIQELRILYPRAEIVVTNGAKQALLAAFYAYRTEAERTEVHHPAPYWPSYPTLAELSGMRFVGGRFEDAVVCGTSPNNPDGLQVPARVDVWDAAYAHWMYGWNGEVPAHQVSVWSASKLLGLSGARVGWLVTEAPWLAQAARQYVEATTSGVSLPAQQYVAQALQHARQDELTAWRMRCCLGDMEENRRRLARALGGYLAQPSSYLLFQTGMFGWFQVLPHRLQEFQRALLAAKVAVVPGEACGAAEPGWFRVNLCHEVEYTKQALEALGRHLR